MSQHVFKVGMRCIYDKGQALVDTLDDKNNVALVRDQHTGNLHTRAYNDLYPDDDQFHSESDTYY
ncbi:hypothetical protein [Agarivorans aestuarii]|jgi:hypothetical protein|uniref:hypothetical protein n=1 Tax=Agarivorans aestuarii TaxID=1563703 RepID=UPI001C7F431D|nr:hypothetical protein [Agarivorans aestuarii]